METLVTQQSDTLLIVNSENGVKTYRFTTPLMEYYEFAREPYREFRRGVNIETYKDSTGVVESTLVADYAIWWIKRDLWEAKGNVVAVNAKGQVLETQQLFWDRRTKKIYSNVDTKVTQGQDVIIGIGFESDESMEDFTFRRPRGKVTVDTAPTTAPDSTVAANPGTPPPPVAQPKPALPPKPQSSATATPLPANLQPRSAGVRGLPATTAHSETIRELQVDPTLAKPQKQ